MTWRVHVRPYGWHLSFTSANGTPPPVGLGGGGNDGWTRHVLRNVRRWVQCQEPKDGDLGITLTLGPRVLGAEEWRRLLAWFRRHVLTSSPLSRWMYVVELQERGQPHLHLWVTPDVADPDDALLVAADIIRAWITHTDGRGLGQWVSQIHGAVAFERYLVKHVSKSVGVSQRQGLAGYGRVWSHSRAGWIVPEQVERAFRVVSMSPELLTAVADGRTTGWGELPGSNVLSREQRIG